MECTRKPHIAFLPSPGVSHLIAIAEFAKRLVVHGFSVTLITLPPDPFSSNSHNSVLCSLPDTINSISLPPFHSHNSNPETDYYLAVPHSLPPLRRVLKALQSTTPLAALVVDLFATEAFDVAGELGIPPYIYFPSTSTTLSLFLHLPHLHQTIPCEFKDLHEPVQLPGCIPFHGRDLLDLVQDRENEGYKWLLDHCKRYKEAKGIFVNSFLELEPGPIKALNEKQPGMPSIHPVGPLVQSGSRDRLEQLHCLTWLDRQPCGSVLYVAFGSWGILSLDQIKELAFGLELSGQRFLWVFLNPDENMGPFDALPNGFMARTQGVGLVVDTWAPQVQVLSHGSTGGFLSHCGWSSALESMVQGVPLIAWPLHSEQEMNAAMLVQDLKVAVRPRPSQSGLVPREEIAKVIKHLTVGEEGKVLRKRMTGLRDAAASALGQNGSSHMAMAEVVDKWKNVAKV